MKTTARYAWLAALSFHVGCGGGGDGASDGNKPAVSGIPKAEAGGAAQVDLSETPTKPGAVAETGAEGQTEAQPAVDPFAGVEIAPIGVSACDAYIEAFSRCVDQHAPKADVSRHRATLREQISAWKQMQGGNKDAAAVALPIGCKTALEGAKAVTADWGCVW